MIAHTPLVRAAACVVFAVLLVPAVAVAEYTAAHKFGRGMAGMTCGFLEIPGNIVQVSRERSPAWGFTLGFAQGLGKLIPRILVGVYETISAPFEVPDGFEPIIMPEYPWDYFEKKTR
jgi:putative exosortase-associated protein (TIGR04073 family)